MDTPRENGKRDGTWTLDLLMSHGWTDRARSTVPIVRSADYKEIAYKAAELCLASCEHNFQKEMANLPNLGKYASHNKEYMQGLIEAQRESLNAIIKEYK